MSALSDAIEERDALRAAYLKAISDPASMSISTGPGSRSKTSHDPEKLKKLLDRAEKKVQTLSGGSASVRPIRTIESV